MAVVSFLCSCKVSRILSSTSAFNIQGVVESEGKSTLDLRGRLGGIFSK